MNPFRGYIRFLEDQQGWYKLLIGSLILVVGVFFPLVPYAVVIGWMGATLRENIRGTPNLAPLDFEVDRLLFYFNIGAESALVFFVWTLPALLVGGVLCICTGLWTMVAATASHSESFIFIILCISLYIVVVLFFVLSTLPAMVAAMFVMLTGEIEDGFRVTDIMRFTGRYFAPLCFGLFIVWLVGIPLSILGTLFCFIGTFPVQILTKMAAVDVLTQTYQKALNDNAMSPLPLGVQGPFSLEHQGPF